jgi:hypothetical protein
MRGLWWAMLCWGVLRFPLPLLIDVDRGVITAVLPGRRLFHRGGTRTFPLCRLLCRVWRDARDNGLQGTWAVIRRDKDVTLCLNLFIHPHAGKGRKVLAWYVHIYIYIGICKDLHIFGTRKFLSLAFEFILSSYKPLLGAWTVECVYPHRAFRSSSIICRQPLNANVQSSAHMDYKIDYSFRKSV